MPVCPDCGIAYLDGESHQCPPQDSSAVGAVTGAMVGACVGSVVTWLGYQMVTGSRSDIIGFMFGIPLGGAIGVTIAIKVGRGKLGL